MNGKDVWGRDLLKSSRSDDTNINFKFCLSDNIPFKINQRTNSVKSIKRKASDLENDTPQYIANNPILNKISGLRPNTSRDEKPETGVDEGVNLEHYSPIDAVLPTVLRSPSKSHLKSRDIAIMSDWNTRMISTPIFSLPVAGESIQVSSESNLSTTSNVDSNDQETNEKKIRLDVEMNSSNHSLIETVSSTLVASELVSQSLCESSNGLSSQKHHNQETLKPITREPKLKTDNFVKVNLRKKCFVKGSSQAGLRQKRWKHKMWNRNRSRYENANAEEFKFRMNNGPRLSEAITEKTETSNAGIASPVPEVTTSLELVPRPKQCVCESPVNQNMTIVPGEIDELICEALKTFKIEKLQDWQRSVIEVILSGESCLVVKPTGSGKSLCYLIPAYILFRKFGYLTIVVSPLISLMQDQVKGLPRGGMKGAAFHSGLTEAKKKQLTADLAARRLAVLYVSPETLVEGVLLRTVAELPPIAFACIDEVHCVSQWSHNFRPTYFRVCSVLRQKLGLACILGSTATATLRTMRAIASTLHVKQQYLFYDVALPTNLRISASRDPHRLQALCDMLEREPFSSLQSILIYCTKRIDCDRVAAHLRTYFCDQNMAESYHAGKTPCERSKVQKSFMGDTLRVVCATVAFGMGLDKTGLRAVVHYNISQGIESYVQEIGRAGRSSHLDAYVHSFLGDTSMFDIFEQERHIYSNFVEPATLRRVVSAFFQSHQSIQCDGGGGGGAERHYHFGAVELSTAAEFDIKEEVLITFLSYLEMHPSNVLSVERTANNWCTVYFYNGYDIDRNFYRECLPIRVALKLSEGGGSCAYRKGNKLRFQLTAIANYCDLSLSQINHQLFACQQRRELGLKVSFEGRSLIYKALCVPAAGAEDQLQRLTDYMLDLCKEHVTSQLASLHRLYNEVLLPISEVNALTSVAKSLAGGETSAVDRIAAYFSTECSASTASRLVSEEVTEQEEHVARQTIKAFLNLYQDLGASALVVCRILQGIDSPQFPAQTWCTVQRFWKSCVNISFNKLLQICNDEVMKS